MPMYDFPVQDVQEVLHGVQVFDPYRWLEDRNSLITQEWLDLQRHKADDYFLTCESVNVLRTRVHALLDREEFMQPVKVGKRLFFRRRRIAQEQACICVSRLDTGAVRVLVDPTDSGTLSSALIHRVSEDGSLLAFAVAEGGSDAKEIHFVDVDSGHILADHLPVGRPRGIEFFPDKTGYYYSNDRVGQGEGEAHSIRSHCFGDVGENDRVVFSMPRSGLSKLLLLGDEKHLGALYFYETNDGLKSDLYLTPRRNDTLWKLVVGELPGSTSVVLRHGQIFLVRETENHRRYVERFEPHENVTHTLIPADEKALFEVSVRQNCMYCHYFDGTESTIHVWAHDGRYIGEVDVPRVVTIRICPPLGSLSDTLFYTYESFDSPPAVLQFDPETFTSHRCFTSSSPVRTGWCTSSKASYAAKDGTCIPVTLVTDGRQSELKDRFVLMTSYGGFGVSMTPQFSVLVTMMLELGAVFIIPHIRGGGEGGALWHQAAVRANRQVAFDDFTTAAEWLCREGITTPSKLAIFGGSNSGLLVAAVSTQRPELFRAVLCIAGLLDMIRYERFDRAAKWNAEFGSVECETEFHALRSYSPYHHIHASTNYPSMLFVSGDKDDRCNPAHSRKMVAQLQGRPAQQNPIVLDYAPYRGHSPTLPLGIRVEALTLRLAFLSRELGIDIQGRLRHVATPS